MCPLEEAPHQLCPGAPGPLGGPQPGCCPGGLHRAFGCPLPLQGRPPAAPSARRPLVNHRSGHTTLNSPDCSPPHEAEPTLRVKRCLRLLTELTNSRTSLFYKDLDGKVTKSMKKSMCTVPAGKLLLTTPNVETRHGRQRISKKWANETRVHDL